MNEEDTSLDFFLKQWLSVAIEDTVRTIVKEELDKFFEKRFKNNENGSIQSVHDNIDNLRNEHIAGLKTDLKSVQNTLDRLQDNFGDLQSNVDGLRDELSDIKKPNGILENIKNAIFKKNSDEIQGLKDNIANLKREVENLKKALQDEKAKVIDANQNYSNTLTRLNVKDGELSRTKRELDDAKGRIAAKERDISAKEAELTAAKGKIADKEKELVAKESELNNTRNELDDTRHELDAIRAKLKEWTSSANIYEPVRNAITKCAIFRPIVKKYGLDDMSDTGLLVYAQAIGKTETFAFEIYNTALENKKQTKEYMTYDEAEVYAALNKVYGYNVFALPGGQNITENFNRTSFDASTSIYLHTPKDKGLPYTTGIYVPILMNKEGRVSQKAYVDASNR